MNVLLSWNAYEERGIEKNTENAYSVSHRKSMLSSLSDQEITSSMHGMRQSPASQPENFMLVESSAITLCETICNFTRAD